MRLFFVKFLCAALVLWALCPAGQGETWYMRVVARDDREASQQEKMQVVQAALSALPSEKEKLPFYLPLVFFAASQISDCTCRVRVWSPDSKTPPRPTIYITIGKGGGHNWWGILYENSLLLTGEEAEDEQIFFYFPLLEGLLRLFNWM